MHYENWNNLSYSKMCEIQDMSRQPAYAVWTGDSFVITIQYTDYEGVEHHFDVLHGTYYEYWEGGE